jgi:hypothetical protein
MVVAFAGFPLCFNPAYELFPLRFMLLQQPRLDAFPLGLLPIHPS